MKATSLFPLLILFALLPLTTHAQSQGEMNQTAFDDFQKADQQLNRVYLQLPSLLDSPSPPHKPAPAAFLILPTNSTAAKDRRSLTGIDSVTITANAQSQPALEIIDPQTIKELRSYFLDLPITNRVPPVGTPKYFVDFNRSGGAPFRFSVGSSSWEATGNLTGHMRDGWHPYLNSLLAQKTDPIVVRGQLFAAGIQPPSHARSLRTQPDGQVQITEGAYLPTKEHVAGFWVLELPNLDEALAWGRKATIACRTPVEVRPFH